MRRVMRSMAYALGGLALLSAAVALPDGLGRTGPAVAEVIHDGTDTTGVLHAAIDCDRVTPGTQDYCVVLATSPNIFVDLTISNSTGVPAEVTIFNLGVTTNELLLDPPEKLEGHPMFNTNPDFNQGALPPGAGEWWSCAGPPNPRADNNPDPTIAGSFIVCYDGTWGSNEIVVPAGAEHLLLATVEYDVTGTVGVASIDHSHHDLVDTDDPFVTPTLECPGSPSVPPIGLCFGATIEVVAVGGDYDGDGVANGVDNCLTVANADQTNTDGNFISNAPLYVVHDQTRANSDNTGNACGDADFDNDGIANGDEAAGCNGSGALDPLMFDTDGDRVFDGAECARGTDPTSAASKPTPAQCGATTDVDGDRLMERIELCNYNTSPAVADTDGDGEKDGCEAVSINGDLVVNSADQLLFSQEHIRVLGGGVGLPNLDLNKDGNYNSIDQLLMAFLIIPSGQCP